MGDGKDYFEGRFQSRRGRRSGGYDIIYMETKKLIEGQAPTRVEHLR